MLGLKVFYFNVTNWCKWLWKLKPTLQMYHSFIPRSTQKQIVHPIWYTRIFSRLTPSSYIQITLGMCSCQSWLPVHIHYKNHTLYPSFGHTCLHCVFLKEVILRLICNAQLTENTHLLFQHKLFGMHFDWINYIVIFTCFCFFYISTIMVYLCSPWSVYMYHI